MISDLSILTLALAFSIFTVNIVLGLLVYSRNTKAALNRIFLLFTLFLSLWAVSSIVSDGTRVYELSKITAQLAYSFSLIGVALLWLFSVCLAGRPWLRKSNYVKFAFVSLLLGALYGTEMVYHLTSIDEYHTGVLYVPYLVSMLVLVILTGKNFYSIIRNGSVLQKNQARIIMYGSGLMIISALITNAIIPAVTNVNADSLTRLGPLFSILFVASIALAIIRHRLFDIRLVVVRSLAYALTLVTIVLMYGVIVFALFVGLGAKSATGQTQQIIYLTIAVALGLTFPPLKRFFDKGTSRLFYRDAYNTQDLLNEFNEVLVSTIDLTQLLIRAGLTVEKYIKTEGITFAIRDSEADVIRIVSENDEKNIQKEALEQIRAYVHKNSNKLFVTDALDESQTELKQLLQESNIAVLARITTDATVEGTGYIVMGYKKSGNVYNTQDTEAIEILANELAIAIQNALQFEEIQKFNVTLQEKVDNATKQLRHSNDKLKQMDETKDEFISMASHQLRTPLTSVKGYLSMVIEGDAGDLNEMQHKMLDQAFVSSQRMVYLIADLLNVSRLRTGKFVIEPIKTNLADVVQGEIEQLLDTAEAKGLELKYEKPKNFPELLLDETKIRQVIMNFTDNSIYYTPSGGHITVELKDTGKMVEFTVSDDGIGVPKTEQQHLFSKFYRAGNAKKARPDGTGLGLFMAKKVIVASGGSMIFRSQEDKGSTFGFSFDKQKLQVPDDYIAPEPLNGIKAGPGSSK